MKSTLKYSSLKLLAINCIFIASTCLFWTAAKAQVLWSFEKENTFSDRKVNFKLNFISHLPSPELVTGFKGTGLRTDGYSTWLTGRIHNSNKGNRHLNGYFALETYPTDTAGFFALCSNSGDCISACIDRFGQAMVGVNANGVINYYGSKKTIPKFKWINIDLQIKDNVAELKVNGVSVRSVNLPETFNISSTDSLIIGRDWRTKSVGVFPVTAINGIIDEVSLVDSNPKFKFDHVTYDRLNNTKPDLTIPLSRFNSDFNRPKYHLLPAANWTNETHGFIFYNGLYHIFNQKNGANLFLGQMNWGHFTSPDLIQWTERRPALTPEPGYDENGIWSGCTVIDKEGKPVIIYTGGGHNNSFGMCLAYPEDRSLNSWKKYSGNPVISGVPKNFARKDFHDPYVWKENNTWYMIIGFGLEDDQGKKGTVLLYKSADLKKWDYLHPLFTGNPNKDDSGVFWEMPVFWKMGAKYILLVNKVPFHGQPAVSLYWTGNFVNERFVSDEPEPKRLEVINRLLSPSVALDKDGNTTAIAIIPDETSAKDTYSRGWTHLFSIPRIWTLENGKIKQHPHPCLKKLRFAEKHLGQHLIDTSASLLISKGQHQLEIDVDIVPDNTGKFGFVIGKNEKGDEWSKIYFDLVSQELVVDQSHSSMRKHVPLQVRRGGYHLQQHKKVNVHLFIDGSVVEGFINNEDAFTTRIFPLSKNSDRVEIFTEGGGLQLLEMTTWQLKGADNQTAF